MLLHNAMAQQGKNPPAMQETQEMQVQSLGQDNSLGQEDPEEGMATHSSTLACRIPWTEEPDGHSPKGHKESKRAHTHYIPN